MMAWSVLRVRWRVTGQLARENQDGGDWRRSSSWSCEYSARTSLSAAASDGIDILSHSSFISARSVASNARRPHSMAGSAPPALAGVVVAAALAVACAVAEGGTCGVASMRL